MILKGSQRAGAGSLAAHLLNDRDNDHVTVREVRGFVSEDVAEAFAEAQAIAKGTKCQQYLFSLSLNPPKGADATEEDFERAADRAEKALGLEGQPRAIILHEKEGRRHAHVVWSRIDADSMTAINMAHFKRKLTSLSKELYLEHGWDLPDGLKLNGGKSPLNYSLAEYQQAKRLGLDPREIKGAFRDAFKQSDSLKALGNALEERGYFLARGDSRALVAVDTNGEVYSVARYVGVKAKDLRDRFGDEAIKSAELPSVDDRRQNLNNDLARQLRGFQQEIRAAHDADLRPLKRRNEELRDQHRVERDLMNRKQAERWQAETDFRQTRLRAGLAGLWDSFTGKAALIKQQNMAEAYEAARRDRMQRDRLVFDQMKERSALQQRIDKMRLRHVQERKDLHKDLMARLRHRDRDGPDKDRSLSPPGKPRGPSFSL